MRAMTLVSLAFALLLAEAASAAISPTPKSTSSEDPIKTMRSEVGAARKLNPIILEETTELGMGYAIPLDSMRSKAVDRTNIKSVETTDESGISYDVDYIESYFELSKKLEINASGSYGGASARASLLREAKINRVNAYVLMRMTVKSRKDYLTDYSLSANAIKAIRSGPTAFYGAHGDSFVSSITYGGELFALFEYNASSVAESQELKASVKASYGAGKGAASFSESVKSLTTGRSVNIKYVQTGGLAGDPVQGVGADGFSAGGVVAMNATTLIDRLNKFPSEVFANPKRVKPLYGEIKDYSAINNWPKRTKVAFPGALSSSLSAISATDLFLREELETVKVIAGRAGLASPAVLNSAISRQEYLTLAIQKNQAIREKVASNPTGIISTKLENFDQYLAERQLGLPSSVNRDNAGPLCDVADGDASRTRECLFGRAGPFKPISWPGLIKIHHVRALSGEGPDVYTKPAQGWIYQEFFRCSNDTPKPPEVIKARTNEICGISTADTEVIAYLTQSGPALPGNHCGYTPYVLTCLTFAKPSRELINPLIDYVASSGEVSGPIASSPNRSSSGSPTIHFKIKTTCNGIGFGAFEVSQKVRGSAATRSERAYWRSASAAMVDVQYPYPGGKAVDISNLTATSENVWCNAPS